MRPRLFFVSQIAAAVLLFVVAPRVLSGSYSAYSDTERVGASALSGHWETPPVCEDVVSADIVLMLDRTGSMDSGERADEKAAANALLNFFEPAGPPSIAIGAFGGTNGSEANIVQGLTTNYTSLHSAVTTATGSSSSVGTHLDSALSVAGTVLASSGPAQNIIILLSDGDDSDNGTGVESALDVADGLKPGTEIFTVLYTDDSDPDGAGFEGGPFLAGLSSGNQTLPSTSSTGHTHGGGAHDPGATVASPDGHYFVALDQSDIQDIFLQIAEQVCDGQGPQQPAASADLDVSIGDGDPDVQKSGSDAQDLDPANGNFWSTVRYTLTNDAAANSPITGLTFSGAFGGTASSYFSIAGVDDPGAEWTCSANTAGWSCSLDGGQALSPGESVNVDLAVGAASGASAAGGKTITFTPAAPVCSGPFAGGCTNLTVSDANADGSDLQPVHTDTLNQTPVTTAYFGCTQNAAVATNSGDNNGYQTNPGNACTDDGNAAVDTNSGTSDSTTCTSSNKDRHDFWGYNLSVPSGATILGIEVRANAWLDSTSSTDTRRLCIQVSNDGGLTWSDAATTSAVGTNSGSNYNVGGADELWDLDWEAADFNNGNFRIRITNVADNTNRDFSLDWLGIRVTYMP
jgi:hypothetical protein